eukprot:COSAG04_NODE_21802_length_367_cov_0.753731_1_plen_45_part_01
MRERAWVAPSGRELCVWLVDCGAPNTILTIDPTSTAPAATHARLT